ncbi:unnamed protein product, partial [Polarella glacialis]
VIAQVWESDDPKIFPHLKIASDGGLCEVWKLFERSRLILALVAVVTAVGNVTYICYTNLQLLAENSEWKGQAHTENTLVFGTIFLRLVPSHSWVFREAVLVALLELGILVGLILVSLKTGWQAWRYRTSDPMRSWSAIAYIFLDLIPAFSTFSGMGLLYYAAPSI